jgi:asparagine synthase (glutamine-hydrolysing)
LIQIVNDRLGVETLFYFCGGGVFAFSDNFWELVNLIEPTMADIDVQSVKEFLLFIYPLFNKTIIRGLEYFPPATLGSFSVRSNELETKQYWDYCFKANGSVDIDQSSYMMDLAFDRAFIQIKGKNKSGAVYGSGLRGGLDSRIIPYYALKNGMRVKSFTIGERRPHKVFRSRDFKNARELAVYYRFERHEVEVRKESYEQKAAFDL